MYIDKERIEKVAIKHVCPHSSVPTTVYERGRIKDLIVFGIALLKEFNNIQPHDVEEYYKE